ncbi:MAG: 5-methyltetrahydropteroyltriglutamate--homocysteine methyltransferase [Acidimicrobiia bacterium]
MADAVHPYPPTVAFDGGDLDCGNGLLLLIRKHIDPLDRGQLLQILSTEASVVEDLPSWCRLTGNELVDVWDGGAGQRSFLVAKGSFVAPAPVAATATPGAATAGVGAVAGVARADGRVAAPITQPIVEVVIPTELSLPAPAPPVPERAVFGLGSWPRPRWLLRALHEHLEARMGDDEFAATADDAVRLAVEAQLRAGVDLVTDGEQRRDNYAAFVGGLLDNCQLIPITDLLPYVDDPETFERELAALDVPAGDIRHPAPYGPLGRSRPLAEHEAAFVRSITATPVKVALPGPYLLTRTMWMECISDRAYADREALAADLVRVLREELFALLADGVSVVQIDEPVLTEVVHGTVGEGGRTFMCGALGERGGTAAELGFARDLLQELLRGVPAERTALHLCRGNWTPDDAVALHGSYEPLVPLLRHVPVGLYLLEGCTPRAGEIAVLRALPSDRRVGVGVIDQKHPDHGDLGAIERRMRAAMATFGADRVVFHPDCGFATFADNPIVDAATAEAVLRALVTVRDAIG